MQKFGSVGYECPLEKGRDSPVHDGAAAGFAARAHAFDPEGALIRAKYQLARKPKAKPVEILKAKVRSYFGL
jgi:hypothetical protein